MNDKEKLLSILSKSKQVMDKTESGDYTTGHIDESVLSSTPTSNPIPNTKPVNTSVSVDRINASRLPEAVKKAMIENPIQQPNGPNHTFDLNDVSELVEKQIPSYVPPKRNIREQSINNEQVSLSEEKIRRIVNEEMTKFFSNYFVEKMTENIQKQTIKNLIESGILKKKTIIKK